MGLGKIAGISCVVRATAAHILLFRGMAAALFLALLVTAALAQTYRFNRIEVEGTKRIIAETRPALIVFGRSVIVHREPVLFFGGHASLLLTKGGRRRRYEGRRGGVDEVRSPHRYAVDPRPLRTISHSRFSSAACEGRRSNTARTAR